MNRAELVKVVSIANAAYPRVVIDKIIGDTFDMIAEEVANGSGVVRLYNFGTFERKETKCRVSQNPKTGETVNIPRKQTIRLLVSKKIVREL